MSKTYQYDKNGNLLSTGDYVEIHIPSYGKYYGIVNLELEGLHGNIRVNARVKKYVSVDPKHMEKLANISDFRCVDEHTVTGASIFVDLPDELFKFHSLIEGSEKYCLVYPADEGIESAVVKPLASCKLLTDLFVEFKPVYVGDTVYSTSLESTIKVASISPEWFTGIDDNSYTRSIHVKNSSLMLSAPKKKKTVYVNMYKIGDNIQTGNTYNTEEEALAFKGFGTAKHIGVAKFEWEE